MKSPVGVERQCRSRYGGIWPRDGEIGSRSVIKVAADRDHNVGRIVGAAQKDDEQARVGFGGSPNVSCNGHGRESGKPRDDVATTKVHDRLLVARNLSA